ncbi:FAD-dependent monooxygenase yanF like protein [Verticillium longisporum]|uniref:FAD-dependent monooxygenase yanF like protein n=1 Tax=Verticillium longisporum TaxID=100787 RepID=A0A0G4LYI8_VERLO|nr:FAD-dependent monooxygenase yanF like protein [Verticillium longisporum]CRK26848.1 hypothetical protein BN1723_013897 [Verticillium longisporum]CRK27168.1 hypothetical protein BN1708_014694 [Verticillium longisporum]
MFTTHLFAAAAALVIGAAEASAVDLHLRQTSEFTIPSTGYTSCDALIAAGLSSSVFFPTDSKYNSSISSYWSGTVQQLRPWCIIQPANTEEVSKAVVALAKTSPAGNWDIGVRGSGHSHFGSNNVAQGVTIDLSLLNSTVYKNCSVSGPDHNAKEARHWHVDSQGIVRIGGGSRWSGVFHEIEKYGRTATGGRQGNVGVGGLSLGGGASFHTGKRGFTCDDIVNYEIVLADGTIANANAGENPDLYRALKGGGNNFGIVMRFDLQTFEDAKGGLYGGLLFLTYDNRDAILAQFSRLVEINHDHPEDTEVVTFSYGGPGAPMIAVVAINTAGVENSTSFAPLNQLTRVLDDRSRKTYGKVITGFATPGCARSVWFSICFQNNMDVLNKMSALYDAFVADLTSLWPELGIAFVIQPLPKHFANRGNGNNVLGLKKSLTHDSIVWLGQVSMQTLEQESVAFAKLAALTAELEAYAESKDASTAWRYLNYVNPAQDPLSTYGEENVQFLKKVAAEYDPKGFFQTRVSGGFKISRVQ